MATVHQSAKSERVSGLASARVFAPESPLEVRQDLFAAFPEASTDSALASLCPEASPDSALASLFLELTVVLVAVSDLQGPELVLALIVVLVRVRRLLRRIRSMLEPAASVRYEISN